MFVNSSRIRAGAGMPVTVYGGIFDNSSKVYVDGVLHEVVEINENSLVFTAPLFVREYSAKIINGNKQEVSFILSVAPIECMDTYRLQSRGASEFEEMLVGMMPNGIAFEFQKGSVWRVLIDSIAICILYVYNIVKQLVSESSPATTTELSYWERELGLPRQGLIQESEVGRKKEIMRISRGCAGSTMNYVKSILDLYGADYQLFEFWKDDTLFPEWVKSLPSNESVFYVLVKVYRKNFLGGSFSCNSKCSDRLGSDSDTILESLLRNEVPAHIRLVFSYYCRILTDENQNAILDDDSGKLIVASF